MSLVQALHSLRENSPSLSAKRPWWRLLLLCVLLLLALAVNVLLTLTAPPQNGDSTSFVLTWTVSFLPYLAACALILTTRPQVGRWQWIELGLILVGALVLRAMLLPLPPRLSHDSLRYLWDARVTLHGYSPYVYIPDSKELVPLRDPVLYAYMGFHDVPTLYPPGAQAIYIGSYLLAPSNVFVLKAIFIVFDLVTCGALAVLLKQKGLDPSRSIIYAWCPLPIVEFAIQGHIDVATITCMLLAILCARSPRWRARILTGFLVALATLTKIYPILLLLVVLRRRDYALLATCALTLVLGYLPYLILGHGQAFGFFSAYVDQHPTNIGVVPLVTLWAGNTLALPHPTTFIVERVLDVVVVGTASLAIVVLRLHERISMEMATVVLLGTTFAVSTHVFPWYTTALLPWVAILAVPITRRGGGGDEEGWGPLGRPRSRSSTMPIHQLMRGTKGGGGDEEGWGPLGRPRSRSSTMPILMRGTKGDPRVPTPHPHHPRPYGFRRLLVLPLRGFERISGKGLVVAMVWYFACTSILAYFFTATGDWRIYYAVVYDVVLVGLGVAAIASPFQGDRKGAPISIIKTHKG